MRAVLIAHGAQYEGGGREGSTGGLHDQCWRRARHLLFALAPVPSFRVAAAFAVFASGAAPNHQPEAGTSSVLGLYSGVWRDTRAAGALGPSRLLSLGATCVKICQEAASSPLSSPLGSGPFLSLLLGVLDSTCWFGVMCDSAFSFCQRRPPTLSRVYGEKFFINQPSATAKGSPFGGLWDTLNTRTEYAMAHIPAIIERINATERSAGSPGKDANQDIDLEQLKRIMLGGDTLDILLFRQIALTRYALQSQFVSGQDVFSAASLVTATIRKNFPVYQPLFQALLTRFATAGLELQVMLFYLVSHLSLAVLEYFELLPPMDVHPARALGSDDTFSLTTEERRNILQFATSMNATLLESIGRLQAKMEFSGLSALPVAMPNGPVPWKSLYPEMALNSVHLTCKYLVKRAFAQLDLVTASAPARPNLSELREILHGLHYSVAAFSAFRDNLPAIFDPARENKYQNILRDQQRIKELCAQWRLDV